MKMEKYKKQTEGGKQSENDGKWKGRRKESLLSHCCTLFPHMTAILKVTITFFLPVTFVWIPRDCLGVWNGCYKLLSESSYGFLKTMSQKGHVIIVCSVIEIALDYESEKNAF